MYINTTNIRNALITLRNELFQDISDLIEDCEFSQDNKKKIELTNILQNLDTLLSKVVNEELIKIKNEAIEAGKID